MIFLIINNSIKNYYNHESTQPENSHELGKCLKIFDKKVYEFFLNTNLLDKNMIKSDIN